MFIAEHAYVYAYLESTVLERGVVRAEDDGVPQHDVVVAWRGRGGQNGKKTLAKASQLMVSFKLLQANFSSQLSY